MDKSEVCPVCGTSVPTRKTHNVPQREPLVVRWVEIILYRLREKRCPNCGNTGSTDIFIGKTVWKQVNVTAD